MSAPRAARPQMRPKVFKSQKETVPSAKSLSRPTSYLTSARSTARSRKGSATKTREQSIAQSDVDDEEDGIRFINIPNKSGHGKPSPKEIREIVPGEILANAQETEFGHVYEIDLHACHIGVIENLEKFLKIKVLDLSCNHIKFIDNLDHNQELRELKLYYNSLTNIENLDKLKDLSILQLQHNKIENIGKGLQALRRLKVLRLDSNILTKIDVREIAALGQLTSLDLSNNRIEDVACVNCLPSLEEFFARRNRLRTVSDLSRCKKLQEIDLSNNKLSDLSGLKNLPQLTVIHATHNELVNLKSLGKLKCLEELFVSHNRLSELGCLATNHPALQILDISDNYLETWQQLCSLEEFEELVELCVYGNPFTQVASSQQLSRHYTEELQAQLKQLQVLDNVLLVKRSGRVGTPLMRPMTASSVVSSRQVEAQISSMNAEVTNFETQLSERFDSIRLNMQRLPAQAPFPLLQDASPRPFSKASKRSRLKQAIEYAASVDRLSPADDSQQQQH